MKNCLSDFIVHKFGDHLHKLSIYVTPSTEFRESWKLETLSYYICSLNARFGTYDFLPHLSTSVCKGERHRDGEKCDRHGLQIHCKFHDCVCVSGSEGNECVCGEKDELIKKDE